MMIQKKMQKYILKQTVWKDSLDPTRMGFTKANGGGFKVVLSQLEILERCIYYDRCKAEIFVENDVKGSNCNHLQLAKCAFVSVKTPAYQSSCPQLDHEDLDQVKKRVLKALVTVDGDSVDWIELIQKLMKMCMLSWLFRGKALAESAHTKNKINRTHSDACVEIKGSSSRGCLRKVEAQLVAMQQGKGTKLGLFDLDYLTDSMNYHSVRSENQANLHAGQQESNQNTVSTASPNEGLSLSDTTNSQEDDSEIPPLEDFHEDNTDGIFTNSSYDDEGAEATLDHKIWKRFMFKSKGEIIIRTFIIVYLLVFYLNMNPRRFQKLLKMKAGLMLCKKNCSVEIQKGLDPKEGIDYDEVFAPVARLEAIRIFLAFASYKGFIVYQMDVKSAFLYGKIDEELEWYSSLGSKRSLVVTIMMKVCLALDFEEVEFRMKFNGMSSLSFLAFTMSNRREDRNQMVTPIEDSGRIVIQRMRSSDVDVRISIRKSTTRGCHVLAERSQIESYGKQQKSQHPTFCWPQNNRKHNYVAAASCCVEVLWIRKSNV
ncbi:putative ribonuclease H-like domain-containing protein [Tanacetum coccineum]